MTSRYSAAGSAHQRDLRTQLFSTPTQYIRPPYQQQHQQSRSQTPPSRAPSRSTASPYDNLASNNNHASASHNESLLNSLETQNDQEMDSMGAKISLLKNLGEKMGVEINKSISLNDDITNNFERGKVTLKNTYNKMVVMSQRAGISWKMWLLVFGIVVLYFFYVWIF
ncbi:uncharacterized protein LODBEIA_P36050 [Lodderomyces beijingensis]|uniref:t-SNARE coiled-coil homology domain-containing protein n=1 Tax=Lodderomyces beijingensis TaxID=1775926 RepID=A0ABP0ZQK8_9ASCO